MKWTPWGPARAFPKQARACPNSRVGSATILAFQLGLGNNFLSTLSCELQIIPEVGRKHSPFSSADGGAQSQRVTQREGQGQVPWLVRVRLPALLSGLPSTPFLWAVAPA